MSDDELETMRQGKPNRERVEGGAAVWTGNDDNTLPASEKVMLVRNDGTGPRYYSEREFRERFFSPAWSAFD